MPGDIRTFKKGKGKAAVLAIGVWAARQTKNGPIHIHITGMEKFHTTVRMAPIQNATIALSFVI
jgi:hypothetical protein